MTANRETARLLRKRPTDAEMLLWRYLRARQLNGFKFRRQEPIRQYIVDFVCFERKIIVEVDGGQHLDSPEDKERDRWFNAQGYIVLRFWNNEVLTNIEGVLEVIRGRLIHPPLHPLPSREGKDTHPMMGKHQSSGRNKRF